MGAVEMEGGGAGVLQRLLEPWHRLPNQAHPLKLLFPVSPLASPLWPHAETPAAWTPKRDAHAVCPLGRCGRVMSPIVAEYTEVKVTCSRSHHSGGQGGGHPSNRGSSW